MKSLKSEYGEKTVDNALKKVHNESADREQHERYRKRLGKAVPKKFKDFQDLKYDNPDEWELIKKSYRNNSRDTMSKDGKKNSVQTSGWNKMPESQFITSDKKYRNTSKLSAYMSSDGKFDLDMAKEDYRKFLQNIPEKNKSYLQQAMESVEYQEKNAPGLIFAYNHILDVVGYNPQHPAFGEYQFEIVNTHELSHRINAFFVRSWEVQNFSDAIEIAGNKPSINWDAHIRYCDANDRDGFLSDILSALCKGKYDFPYGHDADYWQKEQHCQDEIFANLFSLESFQDRGKIDYLRKFFPEVIQAYNELEFTL